MPSPSARRPEQPDPGTVRLPPVQPEHAPDDTGPIPIVGARPAPPPLPGTATSPPAPRPEGGGPPPPELTPEQSPELTEELPVTEQPPEPPSSGRAGRNLGAAIPVGLGLGGIILAPLLVYRPAC